MAGRLPRALQRARESGGAYRVGGGTIRASETFTMPRPSGPGCDRGAGRVQGEARGRHRPDHRWRWSPPLPAPSTLAATISASSAGNDDPVSTGRSAWSALQRLGIVYLVGSRGADGGRTPAGRGDAAALSLTPTLSASRGLGQRRPLVGPGFGAERVQQHLLERIVVAPEVRAEDAGDPGTQRLALGVLEEETVRPAPRDRSGRRFPRRSCSRPPSASRARRAAPGCLRCRRAARPTACRRAILRASIASDTPDENTGSRKQDASPAQPQRGP